MATGFQVIKFVQITFDGNWNRKLLGEAVMEYQALARSGPLMVVFEGATGVMTTFIFRVPVEAIVFVIGDVVHVPARCLRQLPGNAIKCG